MLPEFNSTPPSNLPSFPTAFVASVYTLCTFLFGSVFSIYEVGLEHLGSITLFHSIEVTWYAILGGTASVIAKLLGEITFKFLQLKFTTWLRTQAWFMAL